MEQRYDKETGLPVDRAYLECGLPPYLQRSLDTMKRAWEAEDNGANDLHFDAYYCELQADINSAEVEGEFSSEQAWLDMEQICRLIDETPCLSGLQRRFYKEILALRKERIIDYSLQRLQERERSMLPGHTKKPSRDTER